MATITVDSPAAPGATVPATNSDPSLFAAHPAGSGPYVTRFLELGALSQTQTLERQAAIRRLHTALSGLAPTVELITSDFCRFLECDFRVSRVISHAPARLGQVAMRLRCFAQFTGEVPFTTKRSLLERIVNWTKGNDETWDGYSVDVELSTAWRTRSDERMLRLSTAVLGPDPAEFLDENGVFRQVPLLNHLRSLISEESRRLLPSLGFGGYELR